MKVTFGRIKVPKSYDVLAEHLREKILSGDVEAGSHLPSERSLVDQTGLSRSSIRAIARSRTCSYCRISARRRMARVPKWA